MSAVALAPCALWLNAASEEDDMSPEEQELELLITEQRRDDTYYVDRPGHVISLDAPSPDRRSSMADLIGVGDDNELICFPGQRRGSGLVDPSQIPHGTLGGYNNHRCRCFPCRRAIADYRQHRRTR